MILSDFAILPVIGVPFTFLSHNMHKAITLSEQSFILLIQLKNS